MSATFDNAIASMQSTGDANANMSADMSADVGAANSISRRSWLKGVSAFTGLALTVGINGIVSAADAPVPEKNMVPRQCRVAPSPIRWFLFQSALMGS